MISVVSIILDLLNYIFIRKDSLFLSLFTILSIIFLKKDKNYYMKVVILGFIYDLIFTNYFFLHIYIFLSLGYITKLFYKRFKVSILNNLLLGLILLLVYQLELFLVFNITKINIINVKDFLFISKHFLIINLIYIIIVTILSKRNKSNIIN